jgi:hypothetical protein
MRLCFKIILTLCQDVIIVLLYKNLLAIADIETCRKTFKRVGHLLTEDIVYSSGSHALGHYLLDAGDIVDRHGTVVVETEVVEDGPVG